MLLFNKAHKFACNCVLGRSALTCPNMAHAAPPRSATVPPAKVFVSACCAFSSAFRLLRSSLFVCFFLSPFVCLFVRWSKRFYPDLLLLLLPLPLPRRHKHMQNVIFCPLIWAASDKRVPASTHPCNPCPVRRSAVNIIKSNACNLISDSSLPVCMSTIFMSC